MKSGYVCVEVNNIFYESLVDASKGTGYTRWIIKQRCLSKKFPNYKIVPFRVIHIEKKCCTCKKTKLLNEFYPDKTSRDGVRYECKQCGSESGKKWRKDNPEKVKKYNTEWKKNNPEYQKIYNKEWQERNPEWQREYKSQQWVKDRDNKRTREKKKNDVGFKISKVMSNAIYKSLKNNKDGRSWEKLVGYTCSDFKKHIESLFTEGMSWDNYGFGDDKWNIDHIIPISEWDITSYDCQELRDCWALKNLQPLWQIRNFEKGDKPMEPKYLIKPDCIK